MSNYYADANTAKGFYSLKTSNLEGLKKVFILLGGPGTGKSTLIKNIAFFFEKQGLDTQKLHCPLENNALSGVIIPKIKCAIVNGTPPNYFELNALGVIEEYIDLSIAIDKGMLNKYYKEIFEKGYQKKQKLDLAYKTFNDALKIHDEWEDIYISNMDFKKAEHLAKEMNHKIFGNKDANKKSILRERFLGAATPNGPVDFIEDLTKNIEKRYFIKGRPGTGKSTFLKSVLAQGINKGFDLEVYHCGFDPDSLDMIIIPELDIAIYDSTSPHEHFPKRAQDEILDMYEELVIPGTDEKYSLELTSIKSQYNAKIADGTNYLKRAKLLNDELKKYYLRATDFKKIDMLQKSITDFFEKYR